MHVLNRYRHGIQSGLLAAAVVATYFLLGDLLRLAPLSTPIALTQGLTTLDVLEVDVPVLSQVLAVVSLGARITTLSIVHFAVFALLGLLAVVVFTEFAVPFNAATGALFGLVVGSVVFQAIVSVGAGDVVQGIPGLGSVAFSNLIAGAVMGGYLQLVQRDEP